MQLTSIKIHWSYSLVIASSTATTCSATKCAKSSNESGLDYANKIPEPRHTVATLSTPFTNGWVTTACSFSSTRNTQYLQNTGTQWHKRAQMGSNGQFLHCSCSDWRPFQSQWFSFLIFPIQYLVTKSLSQDNLKRPVCNEGTTRLVRWPSDLKQQPPRDNILRTCKGLVRLMENAGSAVTSVTQPSCPTATSADLSCSSFKLSFKINSRITSTCGVVFGLRWHALTYSLNLVDILRVQKVSCKLHWSK